MEATDSGKLKIHDLRSKPEYIPFLARISYEYWQKPDPLWSIEEWSGWYEEALENSNDSPPRCWVADIADQIVGSVSLVIDGEIADKSNISPWLDGLIIDESLRGKGFGRILHDFAIAQASQLGFKEIYLWTEAQSIWYSKLGWNIFEVSRFRHIPITIMSQEI